MERERAALCVTVLVLSASSGAGVPAGSGDRDRSGLSIAALDREMVCVHGVSILDTLSLECSNNSTLYMLLFDAGC